MVNLMRTQFRTSESGQQFSVPSSRCYGATLRFSGHCAQLLFVLFLTASLPFKTAQAVGTPSGTNITNQATVTYSVGSANFVEHSNITTTRVAELLDVTTQWQDAAPITVNPGDTSSITTFIVTNTGNGNDSYSLDLISRLDGDDFDPDARGIYIDTDSNGIYNPGIDAHYIQGVNDPILDADQNVIVFLMNDIPINLADGSRGNTQLVATSSLGTGPPGMVFPGQGDFGIDAVFGNAGGDDSDIGVYLVSNIVIILTKSVIIIDPFGGNEPVPGATLLYTVLITAAGSGTASNVIVTDSIPQLTTYTPSTLFLNFILLTDEADGDAGDVGQTMPGVITVNLGDLTIPIQEQAITFKVTIN